jgi:hypothetical protein
VTRNVDFGTGKIKSVKEKMMPHTKRQIPVKRGYGLPLLHSMKNPSSLAANVIVVVKSSSPRKRMEYALIVSLKI